ncbi:hypothetical protein LCGC14_0923650 [marine sediment metagenome]|uniref:Uncharacterized protein n=1 Tax=marine sediment metagenome TaxID=412755 RepID=A0A0F9RWM2_9ZZZZ
MDYVDMNKTNLGYQNTEALEELRGTGQVVEVHVHSDYNGASQAYNECMYEGWIERLKENRLKYVELIGGYGSVWIYVKVIGNNGRQLKAYDYVLDWQSELDDYPIWDDEKLSNKEWSCTKENADLWNLDIAGNIPETDMIDMIMNVVSNGWAGNDAANTFHDNMSSENWLSEESVKAGLKALGYRQNPDTDIWYKPTVLIDRVTTCVMALTNVKAFAWWQIWSNGITQVLGEIHRTIGHNPSTNAATLAYAVIDQLYE